MNYIKHLTAFFNKSNQDQTLTPTHISLYLALFQRWNRNRFKNPILISKDEMMTTAKIKSKATYHKCIKELQDKKYITYKPSFNPYAGSEVTLPDLAINARDNQDYTESSINDTKPNFEPMNYNKYETTSNNNHSVPINEPTNPKNAKKNDLTVPNFEQSELKNSPVDGQLYINNKTNTNTNKTIVNPTPKNEKRISSSFNEKVPPTLEAIKCYFEEKNTSPLEAEKFFNYYNSNGWLVGGKTPMKDWQAAARNWILNLAKFSRNQNQPHPNPNNLKPNNLNVPNKKDYSEPL